MSKTRNEVENLKRQWVVDPCWDLEDTEGFEEHKDELLEFRLKQEKKREDKWLKEQEDVDKKAKELGLEGMYRIILKQEREIEQLKKELPF